VLNEDDENWVAPTRLHERSDDPNDDTSPSNPGHKRDPLINTSVSGFQVDGVLGRGAAGIVYQARQISTGRKAAFKVLKPEFAEEPEYIRRLIEEAKALSALRHPGIIDIIDFGALPNGQPYLVMELCEGLSLEEQLKYGGKPTLRETLGLLDELLDALAAAHDHGIIHRDVKPSNLFLATTEDGKRALKVLDFGLARMSDRRRDLRPTLPGAIIGTPDYMAPEQIVGKEAGPWSDIYATGGIAFRLLADRLPFIGRTGIAVLTQKMDAPPPRLRELDPKIPFELDALVHQMMSVEPNRRPSLREVRARLTAYAKSLDRGPTPSMDDSASSRPTTFHQFDDRAASRRVVVKTEIALRPPALSPPSRPTDLEPQLVSPPTDLEQAFVPTVGRNWLAIAGLALFVLGAAGAAAWWLTGH
jgi:serine/threonine protein kinase